MKFALTIECPCGIKETIPLKRTLVEYDGKTYEDYSSITESFEKAESFTAEQSYPDVVIITCKCEKTHELST